MATADIRINPPDLVSDGPQLGVGAGLAGRTGQPAWHLRRPPREGRPRALPLDRTDAGLGSVEDAAARPRRPHDDRGADLPARRSGHRGAGGARRGVDDAAVRLGDHHPAARAQSRHPAGAVADRLPGRARLHADPDRRTGLGCRPTQQERADQSARPAAASRPRRHDGQHPTSRSSPITRCCWPFRRSRRRSSWSPW